MEDALRIGAPVETHRGTARYPGTRVMVEADLRGWLPLTGVALAKEQIARILREAEQALAACESADGSMTFGLSAHLISATGP